MADSEDVGLIGSRDIAHIGANGHANSSAHAEPNTGDNATARGGDTSRRQTRRMTLARKDTDELRAALLQNQASEPDPDSRSSVFSYFYDLNPWGYDEHNVWGDDDDEDTFKARVYEWQDTEVGMACMTASDRNRRRVEQRKMKKREKSAKAPKGGMDVLPEVAEEENNAVENPPEAADGTGFFALVGANFLHRLNDLDGAIEGKQARNSIGASTSSTATSSGRELSPGSTPGSAHSSALRKRLERRHQSRRAEAPEEGNTGNAVGSDNQGKSEIDNLDSVNSQPTALFDLGVRLGDLFADAPTEKMSITEGTLGKNHSRKLQRRLEERRRRHKDNSSTAASTNTQSDDDSVHDTGASALEPTGTSYAYGTLLSLYNNLPAITVDDNFAVDEEYNTWGSQATDEHLQERLAEFEEAKAARSQVVARARREERQKRRTQRKSASVPRLSKSPHAALLEGGTAESLSLAAPEGRAGTEARSGGLPVTSARASRAPRASSAPKRLDGVA